MDKKRKFTEQEYENFRAYHSLQYERIDKLESRREIFNSIVLTASLGVITFGFSRDSKVNLYTTSGLALIIVLANLIAIVFSRRSFEFVKMHQERAKVARTIYAPEFNEINDIVGKRDFKKDWFRRTNLYIYLHLLTIVVVFLAYFSSINTIFIVDKNNGSKAIIKTTHKKPVSTTVISHTLTK